MPQRSDREHATLWNPLRRNFVAVKFIFKNTYKHIYLRFILRILKADRIETCSNNIYLYMPSKHNFLNILKATGHVMHQQFNIQQLYVLPTLYLCVLYLSENKQRLVPLTA